MLTQGVPNPGSWQRLLSDLSKLVRLNGYSMAAPVSRCGQLPHQDEGPTTLATYTQKLASLGLQKTQIQQRFCEMRALQSEIAGVPGQRVNSCWIKRHVLKSENAKVQPALDPNVSFCAISGEHSISPFRRVYAAGCRSQRQRWTNIHGNLTVSLAFGPSGLVSTSC